MEHLTIPVTMVVLAISIFNTVKVFAETKYGSSTEVDALKAEMAELTKRLKKYDDEQILEKVRTLDNRFGRL